MVSKERPQNLHQAVARQVAERGASPALVWQGRRTRYDELWADAGRVAGLLKEADVVSGDVVALCLPRSPALVMAMLGVLRAGAAYLPIDPRDPTERIRELLRDARCRALLASPSIDLPIELPAGCRRIEIDGSGPPADAPVDEGGPAIGPEDLAYVLYTSGSTGRPKGVEVAHGAVLRLVFGQGDLPFDPSRVFLHLAPPAFDAATFEVWGALAHGARLVVAPPGPLGLDEIGRLIERESVDVLWLTASLFNAVVDERPEILRPVRFLLTGGEALSVPHVRRLLQRQPEVRLINGYGPTEGTTFTTTWEVEEAPPPKAGDVPIGRPLAGTRVYLLGPALEPVADGEVGELFIGGRGVARGYRGRPRETAEAFVPDPFAAEPGGRMYRSGDRSRRDPDGLLRFAGRVDDQVKIRGFRVEPGEVRSVLGSHPRVRDAAVVVVGTGDGRHLVAWAVVGRARPDEGAAPSSPEGGGPSAAELRRWLADRLPAPLVPREVRTVASLPLGQTGKLDRRALLEGMESGPAGTTERLEQPASALGTAESQLARAWTDLLGLDVATPEDDFFRLGGHSLLAVRLAARLRSDWRREIEASDVFRHPRLKDLARHLLAAPRLTGADELALSSASEGPLDEPLTAAQARVWFLQAAAPGGVAYHYSARLRFRGDLDVEALRRALGAVVRRHPVYRSVFPLGPEGPVQRVLPAWEPELVATELGELAEAEAERGIEEERWRLVGRPFDLGRGPLVRWRLLRRGPQDHELLHVEHHLLHDGWSFQRLLAEVAALYAAQVTGAGEPPPATDWSPGRAAMHELELESDGGWREGLDWWAEHLADLRRAAPSRALPSSRPVLVRNELAAPLARRLRRAARERGTTLFPLLLAGFVAAVASAEEGDDLLVGTGFANRDRPEAAGTLGMLVNTVMLRLHLGGDPTLDSLVERVRREVDAVRPWAAIPFDRVVRRLAPERRPGASPLLSRLFSFHDAPLPAISWPGLEVEVRDVLGSPAPKFDLNVVAVPRREQRLAAAGSADGAPEEIEVWWEARADVYDRARVRELALRQARALDVWLRRPSTSLADLFAARSGTSVAPVTVAENPAAAWPAAPEVGGEAVGSRGSVDTATTGSDPLLERLLPVWRRILEVPDATADEELFAAGGHSLQAIRLAAALERELGRPVPLAVLLQAGSPRRLAARLRRGGTSPGSPRVVRMRAGEGAPIVLIHGIRGLAETFRRLAECLPEGREVLALEAPDVDADSDSDDPTLAELADLYNGALGEQGPGIHLAGFSFGGALAWEMARRAEGSGLRALSVVVLDHAARDGTARRSLGAWGRALAILGPAAAEVAVRRIAGRRQVGDWPESVRRRAERHLRILAGYHPGRWSGPLTVIRSRWQPPLRPFHHDLGWGRWSDGPVVVRVSPGGHSALLREPVVARVAGWLQRALAGAEER